jgi:seryl-tRNA synthetase
VLDRRLIRDDPERVTKGIKSKNAGVDIEKIIELDQRLLRIMKESDELKHERNTKSEEVARKKRSGENTDDLHAYLKDLSQRIKEYENDDKELSAELDSLLLTIPNIPHESVPLGADASKNVVRREWGQVKEPYFEIKPHWEIGEALGVIDFEAGRKVTGRGYIVFRGDGALLCRALVNMMLDIHRRQGYEVLVPYLVNRDSMVGTGQLPKMKEDMYHCEIDDVFLIPTAEVPVTNLDRDRFIPAEDLPLKYTAFSPCFRREAGSHGQDTRGLLRVHQFDKVEMVRIAHPARSYEELEALVIDACEVLEALELPYRVVELCTGDLSFSAAKCYDLEVFAPGVGKWLEVSSCSNFDDFQARRINVKIKKAPGEKSRFVHTLNGSGVALPRTVAAILEHHQTPTGRVRIPEKLVPYMQGREYMG